MQLLALVWRVSSLFHKLALSLPSNVAGNGDKVDTSTKNVWIEKSVEFSTSQLKSFFRTCLISNKNIL